MFAYELYETDQRNKITKQTSQPLLSRLSTIIPISTARFSSVLKFVAQQEIYLNTA